MVKVYTTQTPTTASYIGDSLQTNNLSQSGSERNVTYTFSNLQMTSSQKYYFYFANTAGNEEIGNVTWAAGRLRVSNNAGHTYSSGNLVNQTWGNQDTTYDAVFTASFSSVPEPSAALLGGLGLLALLRRRR
jgi:MYXO-CTERM domain-containing protein